MSARSREVVGTRAVNQQAWTMTPEEAKTLPLVFTHRNSHVLNLETRKGRSEREWTLNSWLKSYITLYALTQPFMTAVSHLQCEKCYIQNTWPSIRNSHAILMSFSSILKTPSSPSNSCDRWNVLVNRIYVVKWARSIFQLILHPAVETGRVCTAGWSFMRSRTQ